MFGKNIPVKHIAVYSLVMITCAFYASSDNYGYTVEWFYLHPRINQHPQPGDKKHEHSGDQAAG